jgi:hypothetical protein
MFLIVLNVIGRVYMLVKNQVKRILQQCENIDKGYGNVVPTGLQTEWATNIGWIQALRIVLQEDSYPIRKDTLHYSPEELLREIERLVDEGQIEMVVDDEGKLFYRAKEG